MAKPLMDSTVTTLFIERDLWRRTKKLAQERGTSAAQIVRESLESFFSASKAEQEALKSARQQKRQAA